MILPAGHECSIPRVKNYSDWLRRHLVIMPLHYFFFLEPIKEAHSWFSMFV